MQVRNFHLLNMSEKLVETKLQLKEGGPFQKSHITEQLFDLKTNAKKPTLQYI